MSRRLIITIFCFMLGALFTQEANAATRTVDRVDEPQFTESATFCTAAPNDCSLRGAIHGAAHGDVINFDPSLNGQTIISGRESATWANISKNISIVGPGAHLLTISGNNVQQVFHLFSGASVSISGLTIANGKVDFDGAALDADSSTVVSLSDMVFTDNFAAGVELDRGWGGAIANFGAMTINNCAFNGNRANRRGGAIYNGGVLTVDNSSFSGNNSVSGTGGAIYNESLSPHANTGLLTVTNTSFTNNTAGGNGGGIYVFEGAANISNSTFSGNSTNLDGGGIFVNQDISHNFGNLTVNLTNVTFSGNRARLRGGAIFNNFNEPDSGNAVTNLNHVTITNNTANHSGGGVYNHDTRTDRANVKLHNTLIAGNHSPVSPDVHGRVTNEGYNLIANTSGIIFHNNNSNVIANVNPNLLPLANYGGATETHALSCSGSPALNAADPNSFAATDQRGVARPSDGRADIGAFELKSVSVSNTLNSGSGSLRQAIGDVPEYGTVCFDPTVFNQPRTIELSGGEIALSRNTIIEAPKTNLLTIDANNTSRIFHTKGFTLTLLNAKLYRGNAGPGAGGCVFNSGTFQAESVTIDSCTAGAGGGIYTTAGKFTKLMNSTLSNNTATIGGGIYSEGISILNNSTISENTATGQKGGGIYVAGGTNARVDATNSTISANHSGFWGGGVYVEHPTGGLYQPRNTIIAGNTSGDGCPDASGQMRSFGYNLVGSNHCNSFVLPPAGGTLTGNLSGTPSSPLNARLAPLGNYGGTTLTFALLSDSPAINAGDPNNSFNTDQRGLTRPAGGSGDIGAFEVQPPPTPSATPNPAVTNKDTPVTITFTGTIADNNDLTFEITDAPDFGTLGTISSPNCTPTNTCTATVTYTPNAGFSGADSFKFRAKDGTGNSPEVTVNITVISYVVTRTDDTDDGVCDADCSLREAIAAANAAAGPDLISVQVNGTLSLTSPALLIITGDTIIHGNNAEVTRHHANNRIFSINAPATVTINNLVMRDGVSSGDGGCLFVNDGATLDLNDSTVTSCRARDDGGGIYSRGTLNIRRSTISENISNYTQTSVGDGGGISQFGPVFTMADSTVRNNRTFTNNVNCNTNCLSSTGGGMHLSRTTTNATAVIENSTVSGNTAHNNGGGIHTTGTILRMSNVTVSGNTSSRGRGGGLYLPFGGPATLRNCTFANNTGDQGGGLYNQGLGNTSVGNTIFANNIAIRNNVGEGAEIYNQIQSGSALTYAGRNIIVGSVFGTTPPADTITTDPNLLPLGFYGGHTPTRALLPGSSAVNAAVTFADTPSTDQRGFPRVGAVDIGAFEAQPNNLPAASATPNPATTNDDTPIQITLTGTDPEGDDLTFHITDAPNSGTLGMISTPDCTPTNTCTATVTYTPNANFNDGDSFSFKVNDGLQDSTDAPVQIWVTAVNSAPIITEGTSVSVTMSEDSSPTAFSLTLNATDQENDPITWSILAPAANGGATASGTGASKTIGYTPNANFNGSDSFVVQVSADGGTDTITVNVNVQPVNDAPVITEGASASVTMSEEGSPTPFSLTLNATDVDTGTTLTWSIGTSATHGTASATGTGLSKAIGYVPNANFNGTDSFVANVSDGNGGSDSITVNVTVNAQNDTPTTSAIPDATVIQDASNTTIMLQNYFADVEDSSEGLTYSVQGNTNPGLFTSVSIGAGNGLTLDYNPSAFGSSNITIRATDTGGLFVDDSFTVTVFGRPSVSKAFSPAVIPVNGTSTATITLGNPNSIGLPISGTFTDNLPSNVTTVAATAANTCSGTATQTSTSVSLTGGTIPASGSCTLTVSVTSATPGTHTNTIAAGDLVTTNAGSNLAGATANLNVAALPTVAKSFAPNSILTGDSSTVTITLSNSNAFALTNAAITDTMPANVTTLAGTAATTCAGGTATQTSGSVSLSGGTIPANGNCTLTVNVTSLIKGTYVNSIAPGDLTTSGGPNTAGTSAQLDVTCLTGPLTVTSNADDGPGTLRRAVRQICSPGVINFDMTSLVSPIDLSGGQIAIDKNVTIQGPGANVLTVRNTAGRAATSRVFFVTAGVTAGEISGLTISGGIISGVGSAGGGILIDGTLALTKSTVSGNTANDLSSGGGGIAVRNSGVLNLTDSTVSENGAFNGGGLLVLNTASATVVNSTISGNISTFNAGIRVFPTGTLLLQNSTVTNNTARNSTGGVRKESGTGSVTIRSSIIAGNQNSGPEVIDVDGVFTSQGYNLIGACSGESCGAAGFTAEADQTGTTDPQLGALAYNGGRTQTHALQPGSPAIDKGYSSGSSTDQRGLTRPLDDASIANATGGDGSDIGAFERNLSISDIADRAIQANSSTGPISFTIGGVEILAGGWVVTATSSNQELVPDANITLGGSGANRTIQLTPLPNQRGNTTVTVSVSDGSLTAQDQFVLAVSASPTASTGTVSGRVLDSNGAPVAGVVINLSGTQNRKTITNAKGDYYFDNVETTGFYTVTPARVNYNFNPFNRSFSQMGNHVESGFTAAFMGDSANPLDTPEFFVRQQYVDILGREPDEGGFNYWSNEILRCGSDTVCSDARRRDIAAAFFIEQEFQQSGSYIYNVYSGALGRKPNYAEYSSDRRQVVGGAELETQKAAFAESFVQRPEFVQKYQTNITADSFVDALLQTVQQSSGVDLNTARTSLITAYNGGSNMNSSRSLVLRSMADNSAFKQAEYNAAFVLTEYFGYLRRDAEPEGFNFWLNVLNNREAGNFRGMVCSFITSTEYQKRFSSVVTHSNAECAR